MKKLYIFLIVFLGVFFPAFSQVWLEVGAKGMYGLNGLYNKTLYSDGGNTIKLGAGLAYGVEVSINYADRHGLNVEALLSKNKQNFSFIGPLDNIYDNNISWNNLDLYIMYRSYSPGGVYFEIGPKFSNINSIEHSVDNVNIEDVKNKYTKNYYGASLGFGGFVAGNEFFSLKLGVRVDYALGDFVTEEGKADALPVLQSSYKASHPWSANVSLGVNFAIGGVAKAQCGQRVFMLGNGYR